MEIQAENISIISYDTDGGLMIEAYCPLCKEEIRIAEYAWWSQKCSCGIKWKIDLSVKGETNETGKI